MKTIELSVVTVTYKPNIEELLLFVKSFYKHNDLGEQSRLIIVDNSPEDTWSYRMVWDLYPQVDIIPNPSNPGFGASNNIGFKKYQCKYVLFINNDVEFLESIFKRIISEIEQDLYIGCVGIKQKGGSPSYFRKITSPLNTQMNYFDDRYHFISGAFMFFRSTIFDEIGMFDPSLFMYFEEFDISERLSKYGYRTVFMPNLCFLHKVGKRKIQNEFAARKGSVSFCYICKKYKLDPNVPNKLYLKRLKKLLLYHLLLFNINEVFKIVRIVRFRKKCINELKYEQKNI